jgi:hypothetical protein
LTATDLIVLDDVAGNDDVRVAQPTPVVAPNDAVPEPAPIASPAQLPLQTTETVGADEAERPASPLDPDGALGAVVARLDSAEGRLTDLAGRLESANAAVDSVLAMAEAIEDTGTRTEGRVTGAEGRLDFVGSAVQVSQQRITEIVDRLATVDSRLDSVDDQLVAVKLQQADHARALTEVSRTIAVAVERHTSDALIDTRHSLQLAVNSIAQLSLAMAESARDLTEDVSAESATALLDSFRVDLDAILGQLGFTALGTTVGATFDPHRHRALKRVTTADPAQDKVITTVIRDGYRSTDTGRILLFADVEVSRHRP